MEPPEELAKRIIRVINLAEERNANLEEYREIPELSDLSYAEEIKALYRGYRNRYGFMEASFRSRAEVVAKIIKAAL